MVKPIGHRSALRRIRCLLRWGPVSLVALAACAPRPKGHPDIVLVTIDTLRADRLGCYGYHRDTSPVIDALIERHATTLAPVVWPEYGGQRGNPVLFDRVTFLELKNLRGDVGGKPVLVRYAGTGAAERVVVDEEGVLLDIDSPGDLSP